MLELWNKIMEIVKAPFIGDLDMLHLFLLIGLVLIFTAIWLLIITHIRNAAAEVV